MYVCTHVASTSRVSGSFHWYSGTSPKEDLQILIRELASVYILRFWCNFTSHSFLHLRMEEIYLSDSSNQAW